jgi:hypothetical protein
MAETIEERLDFSRRKNYQKTPNKIINYILTPARTRDYKTMPSFKF